MSSWPTCSSRTATAASTAPATPSTAAARPASSTSTAGASSSPPTTPTFGGGTCKAERPNSVTGQLSLDTIQKYFTPIDNSNGFGYLNHPVEALDTSAAALPNQDSDGNNNFYVLTNNLPNGPNGPNDSLPIEGDLNNGDASEIPENDNAPVTDANAKADNWDQNNPHALDMSLVQQLPSYSPGSGSSGYFWIHLLRPANPNLTYPKTSADQGMSPLAYRTGLDSNYFSNLVVVDSFRFPYTEAGGTVTLPSGYPMTPETVMPGTNPLYSVGRSQPYRGGHAVPGSEAFIPDPTTPPQSLDETLAFPYGYSEQASGQFVRTSGGRGGGAGATPQPYYGQYYKADMTGNVPAGQTPTKITAAIYHTLGAINDQAEPWDFFPFNDRDFNSVAELLLVPGAPPGLFTKQFAEQVGLPTTVPNAAGTPATAFGNNILPNTPTDSMGAYLTADGTPLAVYNNDQATDTTVTPYPYASPPLTLDPSTHSGTTGYDTLLPQVNDLNIPHAFPYLPQNFYYTNTPSLATGDVNEMAQPGWYTLLEFFEVPSPVQGAIGPVAQGDNGDWLRNEVRPGMINLNLIYDEEVFFGLVDDPRLNNASAHVDIHEPQ